MRGAYLKPFHGRGGEKNCSEFSRKRLKGMERMWRLTTLSPQKPPTPSEYDEFVGGGGISKKKGRGI